MIFPCCLLLSFSSPPNRRPSSIHVQKRQGARKMINHYLSPLQKATFHVMSPPMTVLSDDFSPDAFTMKALRLCEMLSSLKLRSILYANEGSMSKCDGMRIVLSDKERQSFFGSDKDWKSGAQFQFNDATGRQVVNKRIINALRNETSEDERVHILLLTFGNIHKQRGCRGHRPGRNRNRNWTCWHFCTIQDIRVLCLATCPQRKLSGRSLSRCDSKLLLSKRV